MKSVIGGGAFIASALLAGSLIFSARPSVARTLRSQFQQQRPEPVQPSASQPNTAAVQPEAQKIISATLTAAVAATGESATPSAAYIATAYSLGGRTASGQFVSRGLIAADPSVLPLGTRVRVDAGQYSGDYVVADTGGAVRGKRIDIWIPTMREARSFGRRTVKLTVLSYGPKRVRAKFHHR
jgi:3D (Asp-Asp-Asp) domain-containing protein